MPKSSNPHHVLSISLVLLFALGLSGCADDEPTGLERCDTEIELVITGVEPLGEAYVGQPTEFRVLTNADRPVELAFSGFGSFELSSSDELLGSNELPDICELAGGRAFRL